MPTLNIGVITRENEFPSASTAFENLLLTVSKKTIPIDVKVFLFFQTDNSNKKIAIKSNGLDYLFFRCPLMSTSRARNQALDTITKTADYVMLIDSNTTIDDDAFNTLMRGVERGYPLFTASPKFGVSKKYNNRQHFLEPKKQSFFAMANRPCVWAYVFKSEILDSIRFNEAIGPGSNSKIQCGEDLIFLLTLRHSLRKDQKPLVFHGTNVTKPPRPKNFEKHLAYAFGQGAIWRHLCRDGAHLIPPMLSAFFIFLLLCNATLRVLLCRRNALKILTLRVQGLLTNTRNEFGPF